ncbi:hypothetical protein NKI66_16300 [Mesorhizobium sp. M0518]|uniref:hypothetical protein n=1 Tax=unclassified Mesorhizobium TaxID=325217 RepID=UPI00333BCBE7
MNHGDLNPRIYLPARHAFALITSATEAHKQNGKDVEAVLGRTAGCTLRLIADTSKVDAAYQHGESLAWRDSGALGATLCLVAEWLGLKSTILGFAGNSYLKTIGFSEDRFLAVGAVQLSS